MNMLSEIRNILLVVKKDKLYWSIFLCITLIMLLTFNYNDISQTSLASLNLLDSIFCKQNSCNYFPESAFYFPVHVVFAIWNFPIWIIDTITNNINISYYLVIWSKLFIIFDYIILMCIAIKILKKCNCEKFDLFVVLSLTSMMIFPSVFDIAQYDCFGVTCGLYGILLILEDEKISDRSILFLSLSISFKLLFALIIPIIILSKEKNIMQLFKIIIKLLIIPIIIFIFYKYIIINNSNNDIIDMALTYSTKFTKISVETYFGPLALLPFSILCIYFIVFEKVTILNNADYIYKISYYTSILFLFVLLFGKDIHPFWNMYFSFFLIYIIILSNNYRLLIYETIIEIILLFLQSLKYNWVYFNENRFVLIDSLRHVFLDNINIVSFYDAFIKIKANYLVAIAICFFYIIYIVFIIIANNNRNNPLTTDVDKYYIIIRFKKIFVILYFILYLVIVLL